MAETTKKKWLTRDRRQNIIILAALVALLAFFGIQSPYFLKRANLIALLVAAVPIGLVGLGESCCLVTGMFDMSPGMVATLSGIIWTVLLSEKGVPTYAGLVVSLLFGLGSGLIAGLSVSVLSMPAWMSTYALFQIWKGVIYIITDGNAIRMTKFKAFKFLGQHEIFGKGTDLTWAVVILILAYVIMYFVFKYTKLGRDLLVVGGNKEAAKNVGIPIKACQIFVFVLSGFLSALAGALFASRSGSGQPAVGGLYAMQGIAGAVIGGTVMTGGKTNVAMTFAGVMFVTSMQNGLNMIGVPAFYQHIAMGLVLILAILVQTERKK